MNENEALEVLIWAAEYLKGYAIKNMYEKEEYGKNSYWSTKYKEITDAQEVAREVIDGDYDYDPIGTFAEKIKNFTERLNEIRGGGGVKPNLYQLAAEIKAEGHDKYMAWNQYIIRTGLKPEIDAKEFYAIYEKISPAVATKPVINATHHDNYFGIDCEMKTDEFGVISIIWASGLTGSYPPCNPPEEGRFIPLEVMG